MKTFVLTELPPQVELETKSVLKQLAKSHRYLAELKGVAATIPNETILINTLILQEAKDSSAIENIITTHDELYKASLFPEYFKSPAAKEIVNYSKALKKGFELVRNNKLLTNNFITAIQGELELNNAGFRKLPGTELKNQQTGVVVYRPPQHIDDINRLMGNLQVYINDDSISDVDYLIKMAVIHYQFESIHPFYDGNGRTGRIINILYLVMKGLLHLPILYLSRFIIRNKGAYYNKLQNVRDTGDWENWILFILEGVEQTAKEAILIVEYMKSIMLDYKHRIRKEFPKMYSQDLLNNLFSHPYTKIEFLMDDLGVSRITAMKYLNILDESGFLGKHKIGKSNYYINVPLFNLFSNTGSILKEAGNDV